MLGAPTFHCATDRTNASCFAFGADGAKLVHLIRHGQGHHNVAAATHGAEGASPPRTPHAAARITSSPTRTPRPQRTATRR